MQSHALGSKEEEDEYVDQTIKTNAPELVPHFIGGGDMNLQKIATKTEMKPLKINDFVPENAQTQEKYVERTVDDLNTDGQEVTQSAAQDAEDQLKRTDQLVQQQQYASNVGQFTPDMQ